MKIDNQLYGQVNFLYFCKNFNDNFIQNCWNDNKTLATHLESKFNNYDKNLFKFFFELSSDNQEKLIKYVDLNYCAFERFRDVDTIKSNNTINDPVHSQINVMYFLTNYNRDFIKDCWSDSPTMYNHFQSKLNNSNGNAFNLFMEMGTDNQKKLLTYIDKNYCAFSYFKNVKEIKLDEKPVVAKKKIKL